MNKNINLERTTDFLGEVHDIVDVNNHVIGRATRKEFLQNPKLIRRTAHIWLRSSTGKYWLQKRSATKDLEPSHWSSAVGGFVRAGAHTPRAIMREAQREMREELGINALLKFYKILPMPKASTGGAMVYWYVGYSDGPFRLECFNLSYSLSTFSTSNIKVKNLSSVLNLFLSINIKEER